MLLDGYRWDGSATGAGPLYGLPKDFTTIGFYYNRDLFRRAGLDEPGDRWTWDEFLAAALWTWQKQLRDRGRAFNGVPMSVPKDAYGSAPTVECPAGRPGLRRLLRLASRWR